jgi:hypothetical protein
MRGPACPAAGLLVFFGPNPLQRESDVQRSYGGGSMMMAMTEFLSAINGEMKTAITCKCILVFLGHLKFIEAYLKRNTLSILGRFPVVNQSDKFLEFA